jgi:transcriptional regulator with XRE-family HTH domain
MANVAQAKLCVKGYGKNFKALRENAKLTQEQLGDILHYSDKTISNIESEQRPPSNEQLLKYKDHFNVSLDYLTGHTTVTDVELSKMSEYTGLSEKALEELHKFNVEHQAPFYPDGRSIGNSHIVLSSLIEKQFIQDIAENTMELYISGCRLLSDRGNSPSLDYFDYDDMKCDECKVNLIEIVIKIINEFDERVSHKEEYSELKQARQSEIKEKYEHLIGRIGNLEKIIGKTDNKEGDENG